VPISRIVLVALPLACLGYAAVAVIHGGAWLSAAAAVVLAGLLWGRHPRARFAAYVFFSTLALRALISRGWLTLLFAGGAVLLLQAAPAKALWPRLTPGWSRKPDDRMRPS
jgi:hypothetical protein